MQAAKLAAIRFNVLSRWHIVPSGHSTILEVDPVASVNIDYLTADYCFDRGFHFLILSRDDWNPDTFIPPKVLDIYIDGTKLDIEVWSGVYSRKVELNISLRLPDYRSV